MPRSRDQIMAEWDTIRVQISGGCTNSGPRDWFDGVMDEQDCIIADLVRRLSRVHGLSLAAQAEIDNGDADLAEINGRLVEIAETATQT